MHTIHFEDVLGNMMADKVAVQAHTTISQPLLQQLDKVKAKHTEATQILSKQLQLRQALADARVKLFRPETNYGDPIVHRDQLY